MNGVAQLCPWWKVKNRASNAPIRNLPIVFLAEIDHPSDKRRVGRRKSIAVEPHVVFEDGTRMTPDVQARPAYDGGTAGRRYRQHLVNFRPPLDRRCAGGLRCPKAGVIQFSRVTAVEYAPWNVRVNTVVPRQMHTPLVKARLAHQREGGDVDALLAKRQSRIPLPFMGDGRDTANAAVFLASVEARFVRGTEVMVDGGMSARCD